MVATQAPRTAVLRKLEHFAKKLCSKNILENVFMFTFYLITEPLPITQLKATSMSSSTIMLTWADSEGSFQDSYQLRHQVSDGATAWTGEQIVDGYETTVSELFPGSQYTFGMKAVSKDQTSVEQTTRAVVCKSYYSSCYDYIIIIGHKTSIVLLKITNFIVAFFQYACNIFEKYGKKIW